MNFLYKSLQVANHETAFVVAQVKAVAVTVAEETALGAVAGALPGVGAVGLVAVLPDVPELVLVDVALMIVGTDAGTGSDGAVGHDGADGDTRLAEEGKVAHLALVVAHESGATVGGVDAALAACLADEVEHAAVFLVAEVHQRVVGCSA